MRSFKLSGRFHPLRARPTILQTPESIDFKVKVRRLGITRRSYRNIGPVATSAPHRRSVGWSSVDEDGPFNLNDGEPRRSRTLDRDDFKEASRVHFRTTFNFARWAAHRSTKRYGRHVLGMAQSRVLRGLTAPLLFVAGLATSVALAHEMIDAGWFSIPDRLHNILFINSYLPMTLTSTVLGLLLVFRTNASYARWLDARKAWGTLVNRCRDLTRQGLTWLPEDKEGEALRALLCRWVITLAFSLKCHLREGEDAAADAERLGLLPAHELEALVAARHRPVYAMQMLSLVVREISSSNPACGPTISNMDLNVTALEDVTGTCERILRAPIPLSYTRHTSRFMIIWLSMLPFALWDPCRWGMVPVTVAISLLTLGVEEIGVAIEEPFSILPLEQICETIKNDIEDLQQCIRGTGGDNSGDNGTGEPKGPVSPEVLLKRAKQEIHNDSLNGSGL